MNKTGMIVAIVQATAGMEALLAKDWQRAVVYFAFAIGSAAIAWR